MVNKFSFRALPKSVLLMAFIILILFRLSPDVNAKTWQLSSSDSLQEVINNSNAGDVIKLASGRYLGNFIVDKALTITALEPDGVNKPIIDAGGKGHALELTASNITISHLHIENWGDDLTDENSGIYSKQQSEQLNIGNNTLHGDGFGMMLKKVTGLKVFGNTVVGNDAIRSADRGNGIQISSVTQAHIYQNYTSKVRDGIYVIASQNNVIEDNTMHDLRYGIHYMYSYDNSVINNTAYDTRAGYALMSSRRLIIRGNKTSNSEDYGFLLNYITQSTFANNHIKDVWTKPENKVLGRDGKGLFVYNSGYNTFAYNIIDTAEIGIHLTAGSNYVKVFGNAFINNPTQVKYVSNTKQEWSLNGQGNYWSNYVGWDMDGDNLGDVVFEPNDGIDKLVWQYPEMKMLMDSPAVIILRWIQKQFPVLKPPGVKDSHPLMQLPSEEQRLAFDPATLIEATNDSAAGV